MFDRVAEAGPVPGEPLRRGDVTWTAGAVGTEAEIGLDIGHQAGAREGISSGRRSLDHFRLGRARADRQGAGACQQLTPVHTTLPVNPCEYAPRTKRTQRYLQQRAKSNAGFYFAAADCLDSTTRVAALPVTSAMWSKVNSSSPSPWVAERISMMRSCSSSSGM